VRWVRDGRIGVHFRYAVEAAARWR
jgi:hypothetical protein